MTTTPQSALLSDAAKLADEFRVTMPREVFAIWGAEVQAELRRLDALVAHLTADRDDTANELALRTKHNLALTNECDQLLAKLQAAQPSGAHMNHSDVEELARKANLAQMNNAPEGVFIVDAQALSLFAALVLEKAIAASGRQS